MQRLFMRIFLGLLPMTFLLSACNYLDKPRPIIMRCTTEKQAYIGQLVEIFNRNGYTIVNSSKDSGTVTAVDPGLTLVWVDFDGIQGFASMAVPESYLILI